jgi:catechol 2,3-dioxygenase-like lactoylglutathione lyase family enzyme
VARRLFVPVADRDRVLVSNSIPAGMGEWIMPLSDFHVRASIAVSDIRRAVAFYEGKLGLQALQSGPSAHISDGSRVYGSGGGPALNVFQSVTAGKSPATLATWYVDDIEQVVDELTAVGVEFAHYDEFEHDVKGITARAGGGRIAWFRDPDGNTFAIEADV